MQAVEDVPEDDEPEAAEQLAGDAERDEHVEGERSHLELRARNRAMTSVPTNERTERTSGAAK